jgi:hypothetical protein
MQTQAAAGGGGGEEEQQQQAQEPDSRIHGRTPLSLMRLVAMQKSMGMLSSRPSAHSLALFWAPRGANWCSILHMLGGVGVCCLECEQGNSRHQGKFV